MKVKIKVMSMIRNVHIKVLDDKLWVNDELKNIDVECFLRRLFCIVATWKNTLIDLSIVDGESYEVFIDDGQNNAKYVGKSRYPKNYNEFIKLIDEVM